MLKMFSIAVVVVLCCSIAIFANDRGVLGNATKDGTAHSTSMVLFLVQEVYNLRDQVKDLQIQSIRNSKEIERLNLDCNKQESSIRHIKTEMSKSVCQSGRVYMERVPDQIFAQTKIVTFKTPFKRDPVVSMGIVRLDDNAGTNTRVLCWWQNVKLTSFQVHCESWSDTVTHSAAVAWIAC